MTTARPRPLTHDEHKAAEAAFQGTPLDPEWSDTARAVYEGIILAKLERQARLAAELPDKAEISEPEVLVR